MLTVFLVILCAIIWFGIVAGYFRPEITRWFDNRFGPDHKTPKVKGKPFWRIYD